MNADRRVLLGGCHCGALSYTIDWPPGLALEGRACACDYCARHGAVWTSHPDARAQLTVGEESAILRYRFGTSSADFIVCRRCGILVIAVCVLEDGARCVINVNSLDNVDASEIGRRATNFDGEDLASRLARRRRNWMPVSWNAT
jgi:hypothetical protein